MSDFEDPELQDRLRRLGGNRCDDDLAYLQLQQRVRVAKRRRAVTAVGGLGAACLIGLGSLVVANRGEEQITPADGGVDATEEAFDPSEVSSTDVEKMTTSQPTTTTSPIAPTATTATTVAPETAAPSTTGGAAGVPASNPSNTPSSTSGGADPDNPPSTSAPSTPPSNPPSSNPPSSNPPSNSTPSTGPSSANGEPTTYTSTGGTVTVQVKDGRLTLVDRHANDGYHAEVEDEEEDFVAVRFESDDRTTRIEVRYEEGALTPTIDNGSDPSPGDGEDAGGGNGGSDWSGSDDDAGGGGSGD